MRNMDDFQVQANEIYNEKFHVHPNTEKIRVLKNPKQRCKAIACLFPKNKTDEINKERARKYASDHRDDPFDYKIPPGYKLIGVKGFKNTHDGCVLHVADLIIWKPKPFWLDISPEGEIKREQHRLNQLRLQLLGS